MRVVYPDPPEPALWVTQIVEVDFGLIRPPVALGIAVTHTLELNPSGSVGIQPHQGSGVPTLDGAIKYLVTFSNGMVARSSRAVLDRMLDQCGQVNL